MSESAAFRRVWRLVKADLVESAFEGEGARLYGGRWNSPGRRAVYVSSSLALAALEVLVHLDPARPLPHFLALSVDLPRDEINPCQLTFPAPGTGFPSLAKTRAAGDRWLQNASGLALAVPSALVPVEENFLLNPAHPVFAKLKVSPPLPFPFDPRLLPIN